MKSTKVFADNIRKITTKREFIYDPTTDTFLIATKNGMPGVGAPGLSPHQKLAGSIGKRTSPDIVGGEIMNCNGKIMTDEFSGHYGHRWTPEIRKKFVEFMKSHGFEIDHSPFAGM